MIGIDWGTAFVLALPLTVLLCVLCVLVVRERRLLVLVTRSGVSLVSTPAPESTLTRDQPSCLRGREVRSVLSALDEWWLSRLSEREVWLDVNAGTDSALMDDTRDFLVRLSRTRFLAAKQTEDGTLGCYLDTLPGHPFAFCPQDLMEEEHALVRRIQKVKEDRASSSGEQAGTGETLVEQVLSRLDQAARSCPPTSRTKESGEDGARWR